MGYLWKIAAKGFREGLELKKGWRVEESSCPENCEAQVWHWSERSAGSNRSNHRVHSRVHNWEGAVLGTGPWAFMMSYIPDHFLILKNLKQVFAKFCRLSFIWFSHPESWDYKYVPLCLAHDCTFCRGRIERTCWQIGYRMRKRKNQAWLWRAAAPSRWTGKTLVRETGEDLVLGRKAPWSTLMVSSLRCLGNVHSETLAYSWI